MQHISTFGTCEDALHFAQHSYNVTVHNPNGQLTLHTDLRASYSGAVRREGRTILGNKSKLLYSEIALYWKLFVIGHMYVYRLLLRVTDTVTSQNIHLSSCDTLYICMYVCMYVYVCTRVRMYVYMPLYMYVYKYVRMYYVYMSIYMYVCMY